MTILYLDGMFERNISSLETQLHREFSMTYYQDINNKLLEKIQHFNISLIPFKNCLISISSEKIYVHDDTFHTMIPLHKDNGTYIR